MLVISDNLRSLVASHGVCDPSLVEEFSLKLRLSRSVRRVRREPHKQAIVYNQPYSADDYFEEVKSFGNSLELSPGDSLLGCSADRYRIPNGYFGLVQTKGSLARLFVSTTCNDGQVEPGFEGAITLELTNHSHIPVRFGAGDNVAQVFLFRCSTNAGSPYAGRYAGSDIPTVAVFS